MSKSTAAEQIQRVNMTVQLLNDKASSAEVLEAIITRYGVSRRQAFRYLRQALTNTVPVTVPSAKTVFTVKLPGELAEEIRRHAQSCHRTISDVVEEALRDYLTPRKRYG